MEARDQQEDFIRHLGTLKNIRKDGETKPAAPSRTEETSPRGGTQSSAADPEINLL